MALESINKHAPLRRVKIIRPPAPWMKDLNITHLQHERDSLRNATRTMPSEENKSILRNTRNAPRKTFEYLCLTDPVAFQNSPEINFFF